MLFVESNVSAYVDGRIISFIADFVFPFIPNYGIDVSALVDVFFFTFWCLTNTDMCGSDWFSRKKLNELMESKGGKKKSSSSKSLFYEAPLGYSIEDVRPHGGIKKFRSAAYSNVCYNVP